MVFSLLPALLTLACLLPSPLVASPLPTVAERGRTVGPVARGRLAGLSCSPQRLKGTEAEFSKLRYVVRLRAGDTLYGTGS